MPRYIDADALIHEYYKNPTYLNLCTAINNAPTANVVEMKCLDKITEVHEKIGYEKGYRDAYAQAMEEAIKAVGLNTWAGSRITQLQTAQMEGSDGEIH